MCEQNVKVDTNGCFELATAILLSAQNDYIEALKDYYILKSERAKGKIISLENFFLSDYGQILSLGHGELLIEHCRKIVGVERR